MLRKLFHPLLRRAVLALFAYYCLHGAVLEVRASRHFQQVAAWPVAQAGITSSEVYWTSYSWSGKKYRYCPKMQYTYSAHGQTYSGRNEVFDFTCWPDAYDFVAQHQPGKTVEIAYDPANPAISIVPSAVRDPGYPWVDIMGGLVVLAILILDLFGAWAHQQPADMLEPN